MLQVIASDQQREYRSGMREVIVMTAQLVWEGFKAADARLVAFFFPAPVERVKLTRCPECGGTNYFNGYGVCQECEDF